VVPYRQVRIVIGDQTETVWSRVSDEATIAWLAERGYLRSRGYPDRPPDIDTPTLRLWIARPSEESMPYFHRQAADVATGSFPVYTVTWHACDGSGASVLITGFADGSLLSRVILEDPSGARSVDKVHLYPTGEHPDDVWDAVTRIVGFINEAGHWQREPLVTDYTDYLALEVEIEVATAEARAAHLSRVLHGSDLGGYDPRLGRSVTARPSIGIRLLSGETVVRPRALVPVVCRAPRPSYGRSKDPGRAGRMRDGPLRPARGPTRRPSCCGPGTGSCGS
jgi:hypothetical protein